jgi:hypothetical protein
MSIDNEQYVIVSAISSYRMRYCIPMSELQKLNPDDTVDPSWALDCVTCEQVKEFSQRWLGEQICDAQVVKEGEMLQFFDTDNEYLADWSTEQKLAWVRDWKEKSEEEIMEQLDERMRKHKELQNNFNEALDKGM